jgi:hypothetical protein
VVAVQPVLLLIAVGDGSRRSPGAPTGPPSDPVTGRGLSVIAALTRRWGSLPTDDGKVVWAMLAVRPGPQV